MDRNCVGFRGVVLLCLLMAVSLLPSTASAEPVVRIGYVAPFTGSAAEFGINGWRGIQLALEDIHDKGLVIDGETYRIEVIRYDDRCEPSAGVAGVRGLVLEDDVSAVLGSHCSSVCMAMAP